MSISVGDFAEQLMARDELASKVASSPTPSFQSHPSFHSADVTQQAPDISDVVVPDNFVERLTESKEIILPEETCVAEESEPVSEMTELKSLINEVRELLAEMKNTLVEMTSVGMIGVNLSGDNCPPQSKKDSYDTLMKKLKKKRQNVK